MNDQFTKELLESLGGTLGQKLEEKNVVTKDQALGALSQLSPVILGSLKKKRESVGEQGLEDLLAQAGIGEEQADDLDTTLEYGLAGKTAKTSAVLDESTQIQTAAALSQKLGIGKTAARKLIPMLAPIIIGMLMKKGKSHSGTSTRAGGIGAILDRDGDGSYLDDLAGMVLGGGGQQSKGGFLAKILAMFFGRK